MAYFYFDESLQQRGQFIVGAFVQSDEDLTPIVHDAIERCGLRPEVDEFKSGMRMDRNPTQMELRSELSNILHKTQIGIVVTPFVDRDSLGEDALLGLAKIIEANNLLHKSHTVFIDEGISLPKSNLGKFLTQFGSHYEVAPGQDSKIIAGIQLADLAAHSLGGMLLEELGLVKKMVRAGSESGYAPDTEIELGFELWASMRYQFFKSPQPKPGSVPDDPVGDIVFDVENFGLYVSSSCQEPLSSAARRRFGECYLGCIH